MPFAVADSGIPEEPHSGETPEHTARRLAETKARAVAHRFREALIVGCDQVAVANGEVFGKPGNHQNAVRQLRALSGQEAVFHTAVCVYNTASGVARTRVVACRVAFRTLDDGRPLSDGPNMLRIDELPRLLRELRAITTAVRG